MTGPLRPAPTLRRALAAALLAAACLLPSRAGAFDLEDVARRAEALARAPYHEPARALPEAVRQLSYDQYRDIRAPRRVAVAAAGGHGDDLARGAAALRPGDAAGPRVGRGGARPAPSFLWWILPVVGPLAISIPVAVLTSRPALGRRLRRARVFAIPEETRPPVELRLMRRELGRAAPRIRLADAVVNPAVKAVACAAAAPRAGADRPLLAVTRRRVVVAALRGPEALGDRERHLLLSDARALAEVHAAVQASPRARARWVAASAVPG